MAHWLERGPLLMSPPVVRSRAPLDAGFSDEYYVSSLSILGHCFSMLFPWARHFTLKCFT